MCRLEVLQGWRGTQLAATPHALLAIIEDVPTVDTFSCTNQQDCFSDVICSRLHSQVQLHPAASLIKLADFSGLPAMYLRTCRREAWLTLSSDCAFQPILQSSSCSLMQPRHIVPGQTLNLACHCAVAKLQDRLFYQAGLTSLEKHNRICCMGCEHRPLWCCDSCLVLPNRPYKVAARMALSSCLGVEFNHPPSHLFHYCIIVKLSVPCKPIASTMLGPITSSDSCLVL